MHLDLCYRIYDLKEIPSKIKLFMALLGSIFMFQHYPTCWGECNYHKSARLLQNILFSMIRSWSLNYIRFCHFLSFLAILRLHEPTEGSMIQASPRIQRHHTTSVSTAAANRRHCVPDDKIFPVLTASGFVISCNLVAIYEFTWTIWNKKTISCVIWNFDENNFFQFRPRYSGRLERG